MIDNEAVGQKIAVVTDDGQVISAHFGRARYYLVATIDARGTIVEREMRAKVSHYDIVHADEDGASHEHDHEHGHEHSHEHGQAHGYGSGARNRHQRMFAAIADCSILLARGMGEGAYYGLQEVGVRPIVTTVRTVDDALRAFIAGELADHPERLH